MRRPQSYRTRDSSYPESPQLVHTSHECAELCRHKRSKAIYNSTYKSSVATKSQVNKFLNFIIKKLDKKGFLQPYHKRRSMLRNINNIFHRMNLSEQEIRILLGIFSTLNEFNKKS